MRNRLSAGALRALRAQLRALPWTLLAASLAGCSTPNLPSWNLDSIFPASGVAAVAILAPKNSSVVGTVSFTQRGGKVEVAGTIEELTPGPHRIYIHETGNCSSLNAASAGRVWSVAGMPAGRPRLGDLPELIAGTEGRANVMTNITGISVGDGGPTDVIGRSVVVHDSLETDPRAQFGVLNDWLACGVIKLK